MKPEVLDMALLIKRGEKRLADVSAGERDAVHEALSKPGLLGAYAREKAFRPREHKKPNPVRLRAS